jgi:hypothetical protein
MSTKEMNSLKRTARIAGALILILSIPAFFAFGYVRPSLIVPGNATATANNIVASEGLFRLGVASDSLVFLIEIVLVVGELVKRCRLFYGGSFRPHPRVRRKIGHVR